jgi:hypothetical protein
MSSRFYKNVVSRPTLFSQVIELPKPTTVVDEQKTTVVIDPTTTVVDELQTTVVPDTTTTVVEKPTWFAELNGALFPRSRVRPIEKAQDALTHAEECVYDFLWGTKNTSKDEHRIAQVGYDRIARAARITKRNAALIVDRLIEKGFVRLETEADPLHRIAKQYRVLSYRAALEELSNRGRKWVVRSGNGVLFVHPATVVIESATTVVADISTTVVAPTTVTMVAGPSTTVVATTTLLDNKKETERQSSSSLATVCRKHGIVLDAAAERVIPKRCRTYDPAATDEEIAYFTEAKIAQLRHSRNIGNLVGLLMTAVPEYFVEPATEVQHYRARQSRERNESKELARKVLVDPDATEQEREWAQSVLQAAGQG